MRLSHRLEEIIHDSVDYSIQNGYEMVTPETFLLKLCDDPAFQDAFEGLGGDIDLLADDLENYLAEYLDKDATGDTELSAGMAGILAFAGEQAINSGKDEVQPLHVVFSLWALPDCYAVYFMEKQGIDKTDLIRALSSEDEPKPAKPGETGDVISLYAPCINDTADQANPLIGREEELERTIQVLCRKDKNNPLHIGEPGVGKTAIIYGLAQRINKDEVPAPLKGSRIFMLDMGGMLAGTQYRGDFEKRFKSVLEAISKEEHPIVYIDEIHSITGAGAVAEGANDAANMLKPYLSSGHIRFIGATTFDEYKKRFEKNKGLARRFQNIEIKEPSIEDTVKILEGLKNRYESFHGVRYAEGVLDYAAKMSAKYINERFLPDKAIDLIDEAGSYLKLHPAVKEDHDDMIPTVDKDLIAKVLSKICRVPVETVESEDTGNLETLEDRIKAKIFGQDEAVTQVVNAIKFSRAGLSDENKPLASLLFVGPTGVGKTEVARSLASELGAKLIRFDMSEYAEKHTVAKLIGSPAGYVGYEEGGLLTEEIRKNPSSILLLDEIEKAHPDIYSILLQVMDYATLTDNQGRKADFKNVVVIMTSNAGANFLGKKSIGFNSGYKDNSALMEEVKRIFQPEFRNRLNRIIMFNGMDDEMAALIVDKKLGELSDLLKNKNITLNVEKSARELILKKGISREFGAREVDRVIRNEIKPLFVDEILFGKLKNGGSIS
nr:AAA family ATPase [Lachnospiraceae bacterium]